MKSVDERIRTLDIYIKNYRAQIRSLVNELCLLKDSRAQLVAAKKLNEETGILKRKDIRKDPES